MTTIGAISSFFSGIATTYRNLAAALSAVVELRTILENKRRVLLSALLVMAGFVFVMSAIVLGTIELALQYEAQGFILWSAMVSVAVAFFLLGALCAGLAAAAFPRLPAPRPAFADGFQSLDLATLLTLYERFRHPRPAPSAADVRAERRENERAATRQAQEYEAEVRARQHGDFAVDGLEPRVAH